MWVPSVSSRIGLHSDDTPNTQSEDYHMGLAVRLIGGALVALPLFAATGEAATTVPRSYTVDQAVVPAAGITRAQAIAIALNAVGGGRVTRAVLEREDNGMVHWSVDITQPFYDYEVWIALTGKVLRIVQQPH
jgi:uncharacterized membrane protein YkoI